MKEGGIGKRRKGGIKRGKGKGRKGEVIRESKSEKGDGKVCDKSMTKID